jgi:hypothetical protein
MAGMELDPDQRRQLRFEGKITEIQDISMASTELDRPTRDKLTAVTQKLLDLLYDDTPKGEAVERWDNSLSRCLEDLGGARRASLDTGSAEKLHRCLSEIAANMMKGRPR